MDSIEAATRWQWDQTTCHTLLVNEVKDLLARRLNTIRSDLFWKLGLPQDACKGCLIYWLDNTLAARDVPGAVVACVAVIQVSSGGNRCNISSNVLNRVPRYLIRPAWWTTTVVQYI
jgi:hypothetical protein